MVEISAYRRRGDIRHGLLALEPGLPILDEPIEGISPSRSTGELTDEMLRAHKSI